MRRVFRSPVWTALLLGGCGLIPGRSGEDGADGLPTLAMTSVEPAGANCPLGGLRVDYGIDDDGSGTLDANEVDGSSYVCDGADGANGADGSAGDAAPVVLVNSELVFERAFGCAQGYRHIELGPDDGSGGGIAGDGMLQDGEIDAVLDECIDPNLDGDIWLNLDDNCPQTVNDFQVDRDGDDLGDACETPAIADEVYAISRSNGTQEVRPTVMSALYALGPRWSDARKIGSTGHALVTVKFNPADHALYGMTRWQDKTGGCDGCLVKIDTTTGAAFDALPLRREGGDPDAGEAWPSLAFLSDGRLFGWTEWDDELAAVDLETGFVTTLDGTWVSSWAHGICVPDDDTVVFVNGDLDVYRIDPAEVDPDGRLLALGYLDDGYPYEAGGDGIRGDCDPRTLRYWGVNTTQGGDPVSMIVAQLDLSRANPEDPGDVVFSGLAPVANFHGIAIYR